MLLPLYTVFDPAGSIAKPFIVIMCLLQIVILGYRYISAPFFDRSVQLLICSIDACLFWISLTSLICGVVNDGSVGIFYMFGGAPLVCAGYLMLIERR